MRASGETLGGRLDAPGGLLGALGGLLGASGGPLGGLLGASWAVLEASWGLLAANTHRRRGGYEFLRPLGAVLGSFLGGFGVVFLMNVQHLSYLILQDINML